MRSNVSFIRGITEAIGRTPLIRLNSISNITNCNIYGKAEFMNPCGSVKDRTALFLIKDAEDKKLIGPGATIIESTAGNTGIALAQICLSKGYKCIIYIPNNQSPNKIDILRRLGAQVIPVPVVPYTDPKNYNHQAKRHAENLKNSLWTNQFDNTANRQAHFETTGPEIWEQLDGKIDAFTCSIGTGGTFAGVSAFLKKKSNGRVKCILADPPGSVLFHYIKSGYKELKRTGDSSITEGIGQGRITQNLEDHLDKIDDCMHIPDRQTIQMVYRILHEEGLFLGASTSLNIVAALETAKLLGSGKNLVTILCDGAQKYQNRLFNKKWLEEKGLWNCISENLKKYAT